MVTLIDQVQDEGGHWPWGGRRKSYWRLSITPATRIAMPNQCGWRTSDFFRSNNSGATLLRFEESHSVYGCWADPHA